MTLLVEILVAIFLVIGSIFALVGTLGMVRLRDPLQRLHAPTKATTLGISGILIASSIYFTFAKGELSFHGILIVLFLFLTAPISANFISKVYIIRHLRNADLPPTKREHGWAIYDDPPSQKPVERSS